MSSTRRLPLALDRRLVDALADAPGAGRRTREFGRAARAKVQWRALSLSGILHLAAFLALSVLVLPIDLGELSVISAEMVSAPEQMPLETLATEPEAAWDALLARAAVAVVIEYPEPLETLAVSDPDPADFPLTEVPLKSSPKSSANGDLAELLTEGRSARRRTASTGGQAKEPGQEGQGTAEYFGTVAHGDRFVYVLDMSGSMKSRSGAQGPTRFDRAVSELLRSIEQIEPDQWFYVVLFSSHMRRMFDHEATDPKMLEATPGNKQRLRKWIRKVKPGGGTNPREAIQLAFSLNPSAVFMLSDGEFSGVSKNNISDLFGANAPVDQFFGEDDRGWPPIHSFAYENPNAKANMQALAALTGGRFQYIEPTAAGKPAASSPITRVAGSPRQTGPLARPVLLPPRQQAEVLLKRADALRDAGNNQQAVQSYRDLIHEYPLTPAGVTARGRIVQILHALRMNSLSQGGPR